MISKWHTVTAPKSGIISSIKYEAKYNTLQNFKLWLGKIELRIFEGHDFWFKPMIGLEEGLKRTIAAFGNEIKEGFAEPKPNEESKLSEYSMIDEIEEVKNFFEDEDETKYDEKGPAFDEDKGYVRKSKRWFKKFFGLLINNTEVSYLQLDDNHPTISSQLGFTVGNIKWNEVRPDKDFIGIFNNDLDIHKNIGMKIIFLKNHNNRNERGVEIYLKIESMKIKFSPLSLTFGYLLSFRLSSL